MKKKIKYKTIQKLCVDVKQFFLLNRKGRLSMKVILIQKLLIFRQIAGVPRLERRWWDNSLDLEMTGSHTVERGYPDSFSY